MEYGLRAMRELHVEANKHEVLILVLMEYGLRERWAIDKGMTTLES